jgi:hypothetical protein
MITHRSCLGLVRRKRKQGAGVDFFFPFPWNPHLSYSIPKESIWCFLGSKRCTCVSFLRFAFPSIEILHSTHSLSLHWTCTNDKRLSSRLRVCSTGTGTCIFPRWVIDYGFLIFLVIWFSQYHTVWCQIITWSLFAKNRLGHRQRL